jgi:hypothetical protein
MISSFTPQRGDFARIGLPDDIAGQTLLARLHKVLGPLVVQTLGNAFAPTQLGDAVFAAQAVQHNTDLLLRTVWLTRLTFDVLNDVL